MTISIRKFLVLNLLLVITITTTLTALGNYFLDNKDIQNHLDDLLVQSALSIQAMMQDDLSRERIEVLQKNINDIPFRTEELYTQHIPKRFHLDSSDKFQFQIWDTNQQLLLHSAYSPSFMRLELKPGFKDKTFDGKLWRVFTTFNDNTGLYVVVAEQYDIRNNLADRIARDDLYILLLTFPLSGLLIWIVIGKGLQSLHRVAREVAHRAPSFLDPVGIHPVPTEVKPLVEELNKLFLRLKMAFEREQRFAADAAHELRTPLAALKTQAQVALNADNEAERKSTLRQVISAVDRCAHVVQQLLTLSRIAPNPDGTIHEVKKVELNQLVAEVLAQQAPLAFEKDIKLELKSDHPVLHLMANATALSVLVRNLVDNAIRYTPKHGQVTVSLIDENKQINLMVTDNGPGIPAELRARVFERFYRVLGNKSPGSGLGLAIVQQIAKMHQAEVILGSPTNHQGLQVEILLPKRC